MHDIALDLVELNEADMSALLQTVQVPGDDIASFYWISGTPELGVSYKPVDSTLNPMSCVTDKDPEYFGPSTGR